MKRVEIWPRGYAHESGLKVIKIADDADPIREARKAYGNGATVYSVRDDKPVVQVEIFSEGYIRTMSQNDNS